MTRDFVAASRCTGITDRASGICLFVGCFGLVAVFRLAWGPLVLTGVDGLLFCSRKGRWIRSKREAEKISLGAGSGLSDIIGICST